MARRLVAADIRPYLWNRSEDSLHSFRGTTAILCGSAGEVVQRSDVIIFILADDDALAAVLKLGGEGPPLALAGKIIVNMGTGSPARSLSHQAAIEALGGVYIEAPVSGSRQPAEDGRLLAMVAGGSTEQRELVANVIAPLCRATIDMGAVPKALRMKLAINLYLVTSVAALAEAYHLAGCFEIDPQRFAEVLAASPMASEVVNAKSRKIAARDFSVQATISDVYKNCRLIAEAAGLAGASTPLLAQTRALFAAQDGERGPHVDMAAVVDSFRPKPASSAASVVARQLEAYQRKDLADFMACWAETAVILGPDDKIIASGSTEIRARHQCRFADPALQARLLTRTVVGAMVVDEELVRRTSARGALEEVRVLATYSVRDDLIVRAALAEEPADGQ